MLRDYLYDGFRFNEKRIAIHIDPHRHSTDELNELCSLSQACSVDLFLVCGHLSSAEQLELTLRILRTKNPDIPLLLVCGSLERIDTLADAMMLLNTNPASDQVKKCAIEVLPTGYIALEGEKVDYVASGAPKLREVSGLTLAAALEFQNQGYSFLYLDAGFAAQIPVSFELIREVREVTTLPLFVGGGIRTPDQAHAAVRAGADIIVLDAAIAFEPALLPALCQAVHSALHLT